jgi:hypothetical protein
MIKDGELVFLHFFDVGGEIELKGREPRLEEYGKVRPEHFPGASWIEDSVRIEINESVNILGEKSSVEVKIFSVGGILVKVTMPLKFLDFSQVLDLISRSEDQLTIGEGVVTTMADFAKELADRIKVSIEPFISNKYTSADYMERYRAIIVKEGDKDLIKRSREIVGLIRKEPIERLSNDEVSEIVSNRYAFRENFLIADIRGAFAFVKNAETFHVIRMLELCLLQRLELRVYDSLLDDMLGKSYNILEKAESKANREVSERINDIHLMRLELLEIVSAMKGTRGSMRARISSSLRKTIGEELELEDLEDSVTRKLDRLGEIYKMVYDSLQNTRFMRMDRTMLMLESIIVILIVVEIFLSLVGKK